MYTYTTRPVPPTTTSYVEPITTSEPIPATTTTTINPTTTTTIPYTTTTTSEIPPATTPRPSPTTTTTSNPVTTSHTQPTHTHTQTSDYISSHTLPSETTTSNPYPIITATTTGGTLVSPTLPPSPSKNGISSGAIAGIVIAAVVILIAALISIYLIKRRRRHSFKLNSDILFNPCNNDATLTMQENQHYYPTSPTKDFVPVACGDGTNEVGDARLNGRESVEPLNTHAAGTNVHGVSGVGSGASDSSCTSNAMGAAAPCIQDSLYPCEADPGYTYPYHYPPHYPYNGNGYHGPAEAAYSHYGAAWNESADYNMAPESDCYNNAADAAAYAQYEQEQQDLYRHQMMMMPQHGVDLQGPVEYYDPRASSEYYPCPQPPPPPMTVYSQSQPPYQLRHGGDFTTPVSPSSASAMPPTASDMPTKNLTVSIPEVMSPTTNPASATSATAYSPRSQGSPTQNLPMPEPRIVQQYYADTENDAAYTSKSEPWQSPRRHPQVLINNGQEEGQATWSQIKVPVSYSDDIAAVSSTNATSKTCPK
ncbi:hypothetical protein FBU30_009413 [Linnemannia zychae]|nr:hypothetical protein FBU30_009413 [Linnemannia zychae]